MVRFSSDILRGDDPLRRPDARAMSDPTPSLARMNSACWPRFLTLICSVSAMSPTDLSASSMRRIRFRGSVRRRPKVRRETVDGEFVSISG